ncbi:MAG: cell division protein ZapA [Oscillospiraceae bacterium]|nr:cell division protein ZapA [Oscillospiraceae bacterium]
MPLNKVKINVAGTNYVLNTQDSEQEVLALAATVDKDINDIMEKSPSASVAAAAIICAMTYLDKYNKSNNGSDNMRAQLKEYLEEANRARGEAEKAKLEVEKLKVDLQYLKNQVEKNGSQM